MHTAAAPASYEHQPDDPATLFHAGRVNVTPEAAHALERCGQDLTHFLARHAAGDWMDMSIDEAVANTEAIATGGLVRSAYDTDGGTRLHVITDQQRGVTLVLLSTEH